MPVGQIVTEAQAAGFKGFVVDRSVVSKEEYADLKAILLARTGGEPLQDSAGRLAFWRLPDPGYRLGV